MNKSKQGHCSAHSTRLQIYKERPQRTPDAPGDEEGVERRARYQAEGMKLLRR